MTLDEDAAKAVDDVLSQFPGAWVGGRQKIIFSIAMTAFGRRCAEQMREECHKAVDKLRYEEVEKCPDDRMGDGSTIALVVACQAIRWVEVK